MKAYMLVAAFGLAFLLATGCAGRPPVESPRPAPEFTSDRGNPGSSDQGPAGGREAVAPSQPIAPAGAVTVTVAGASWFVDADFASDLSVLVSRIGTRPLDRRALNRARLAALDLAWRLSQRGERSRAAPAQDDPRSSPSVPTAPTPQARDTMGNADDAMAEGERLWSLNREAEAEEGDSE